ncbi:hypothetical protein F4778DRAFT_354333 [Xylariomycetidae sp. FL2044]|nr:hypothetical protein F4778DRAFT_354333 [Xylariomycetidae sp. FL2044]
MAPTKYHKFPAGERCDECGSRHWYAQDALRYCRHGHRLEGFAAHEGDEDDFGTQGRVSRRKRERRQKVALKLTGPHARALYLEALQFVLLRQVRWLVGGKGFPADLEELVRALWALRVRGLVGDGEEGDEGRTGGEGEGEREAWSASEGGGGESEGEEEDTRGWGADAKGKLKLPRLVDTVVLCYLGCLVRRLPVTTADFHGWCQRGEMDYLAALNGIPRNVRDRLPAEYLRALQVRDHIKPGYLQNAVQKLIISFHARFDMIFPPLNYAPMIIRLITELTLPVEIYPTVKYMAELLKTDYSYPIGNKMIRTMDNPEAFLVTLIIVSTKLLYPLDGVQRPPVSHYDPRSTKIDWEKWKNTIENEQTTTKNSANLIPGEEYKVTANDVLTMDKTRLDDFMDWFEKMWIGDGDPKTVERIREPFQEQKRLSEPARSRSDQEELIGAGYEQIRARYAILNSAMTPVEPVEAYASDEEKRHPRNFCPVWRSEADLPPVAKVLYARAAGLAALPLDTLLLCAVQVERQLEVWCLKQAKEKRGKEKGKGKGKQVWTGDDSLE